MRVQGVKGFGGKKKCSCVLWMCLFTWAIALFTLSGIILVVLAVFSDVCNLLTVSLTDAAGWSTAGVSVAGKDVAQIGATVCVCVRVCAWYCKESRLYLTDGVWR